MPTGWEEADLQEHLRWNHLGVWKRDRRTTMAVLGMAWCGEYRMFDHDRQSIDTDDRGL